MKLVNLLNLVLFLSSFYRSQDLVNLTFLLTFNSFIDDKNNSIAFDFRNFKIDRI